jgi:hypothetical protein
LFSDILYIYSSLSMRDQFYTHTKQVKLLFFNL